MKTVYRLGTRRSALATTQSTYIKDRLAEHGANCELVLVDSDGDKDRKTPLYQIESQGPGLFTKHLENALLEKKVDLAVHSLKDLPTLQPKGLLVGAVPVRASARDCLILHPSAQDPSLPLGIRKGATVGTSSLRREAELLSLRPDLKVAPLRGNVPTRVRAVASLQWDGILLAEAGLDRLQLPLEGLSRISLSEKEFVPAPGQGALAVEIRSDASSDLIEALKAIHDSATATETRVERKILRDLEGGCTLPLGVRCHFKSGRYEIQAFLGIARDQASERRQWIGFHHFDISGTEEETLVDKTVAHFKEYTDAQRN